MAISKGKILAQLCPTGSQPVTRARLRCGPEGAPWVLLFTGQLPGSWAEGSAGGGVTCGSPSPSSAPGTRSLWVLWEARLVARLCLDLTLPVKGFPVAPRSWLTQLNVPGCAPSCPLMPHCTSWKGKPLSFFCLPGCAEAFAPNEPIHIPARSTAVALRATGLPWLPQPSRHMPKAGPNLAARGCTPRAHRHCPRCRAPQCGGAVGPSGGAVGARAAREHR